MNFFKQIFCNHSYYTGILQNCQHIMYCDKCGKEKISISHDYKCRYTWEIDYGTIMVSHKKIVRVMECTRCNNRITESYKLF